MGQPLPLFPSMIILLMNYPARENVVDSARSLRHYPAVESTASSRYHTQRSTRRDAIYNSRPLELSMPPITMYHPVFARFMHLMKEKREDFTSVELDRALEFISAALKYRDQGCGRKTVTDAMAMAVDETLVSSKTCAFALGTLDIGGAVCAARVPTVFDIVSVIVEMKTDSRTNPIAQTECDYVSLYSSKEVCLSWCLRSRILMLRCQADLVRKSCCCPAFLIGIVGMHMTVSGAIFTERFVCQMLTDLISIMPYAGRPGRSPLDDAIHRMARLFRALRICIGELKEYYTHLVESMDTVPPIHTLGTRWGNAQICTTGPAKLCQPPHMISPHFTTFNVGGDEVRLEYWRRLESDDAMKPVFLADAKRGSEVTKVVVKFTYKYNVKGHKLLAEVSQAPKLHHCQREESVCMWVVVMDYVQGAEVKDVLTDPAHIASLRAAVTRLHDHGLVFGDLRKPNLLVVEERVMLVNFDWCGEEGKASYPDDVSRLGDTTNWHSGVKYGAGMLKEHDAHRFKVLTEKELSD